MPLAPSRARVDLTERSPGAGKFSVAASPPTDSPRAGKFSVPASPAHGLARSPGSFLCLPHRPRTRHALGSFLWLPHRPRTRHGPGSFLCLPRRPRTRHAPGSFLRPCRTLPPIGRSRENLCWRACASRTPIRIHFHAVSLGGTTRRCCNPTEITEFESLRNLAPAFGPATDRAETRLTGNRVEPRAARRKFCAWMRGGVAAGEGTHETACTVHSVDNDRQPSRHRPGSMFGGKGLQSGRPEQAVHSGDIGRRGDR